MSGWRRLYIVWLVVVCLPVAAVLLLELRHIQNEEHELIAAASGLTLQEILTINLIPDGAPIPTDDFIMGNAKLTIEKRMKERLKTTLTFWGLSFILLTFLPPTIFYTFRWVHKGFKE